MVTQFGGGNSLSTQVTMLKQNVCDSYQRETYFADEGGAIACVVPHSVTNISILINLIDYGTTTTLNVYNFR